MPRFRTDARRSTGQGLRYPDHIASRYEALLLRRQATVYRVLRAHLDVALARRGPDIDGRARQDAMEEDLQALLKLISVVETVVREEFGPAPGAIGEMARQLDLFSRRQVEETVKRIARVDILPGLPGADRMIEAWTRDNVELITSIDTRFFDELRRKTEDALRTGRSTRDLVEDIEDRYQVSRSRAKLIARDQVSKANGQITQARFESLGIEEYIWRTSRDERVRGNPAGLYPDSRTNHYALEGQRFRVRGPGAPGVGHPGDDFQCRCTAEPVLPGDTAEQLQAYDRQAKAAEQARAAFSQIARPGA